MELIKFQDNWADEMDIHSFYIYPKGFFEEFTTLLNLYFEQNSSINIYVGSNQDIDITKNTFEQIFTMHEITEEETNTFLKYFNEGVFGNDVMTSLIDTVLDSFTEDELKEFEIIYNMNF